MRGTPFGSPVMQRLFEKMTGSDPERLTSFEEEVANAEIARLVYDHREEAGLSHDALARLAGLSADTVARVEEADYEGDALAVLHRVASALGRKVEIQLVSAMPVER